MYVREAPDKKLSKRTREFMTIADIQRMKGNCRGLGQNVDLKNYIYQELKKFFLIKICTAISRINRLIWVLFKNLSNEVQCLKKQLYKNLSVKQNM